MIGFVFIVIIWFIAYFFCAGGLKLSKKIPEETRSRVIIRLSGLTPLDSVSMISERIVPKIGVVKLNTDTLETGLCLRSIPQRA